MDQLEEYYQNTQEDSYETEIMDVNTAPSSIKRRLFPTKVTIALQQQLFYTSYREHRQMHRPMKLQVLSYM